MQTRVAFVKRSSYDPASLKLSLIRSIELSGFDLSCAKDKRVLLKPNMLGAYPPNSHICTHPEFVKAVAKIFIDAGAIVSVGDSPNGIMPIDEVWERTGIARVCKELKIDEVRFEKTGSLDLGEIKIAKVVKDVDMVINLPKFKTHGLTILTLAAKNLFGCISGMQKTNFHRICRTKESFADIVVKTAHEVSPALTIIDGIVGMDGNGPSGGNIKELGVIVCGTNIHAVDAACSNWIGLEPFHLDTLAAAERMKLWNRTDYIDIVGDVLPRPDFGLPSTYTKGMRDWWISKFVLARIWGGMTAKPVISKKRCKICLLCVKSCPVSTIFQKKEGISPQIDSKKCIECLCCHEICPHRAIDLREGWTLKLAKLLSRFRLSF